MYQPILRRDLATRSFATLTLVLRRGRDVVGIRGQFRSGGFSHLHVHYGYFAVLAPGLPFSLHLHGGDLLFDLASGLKARLTRSAINRASHIVVSTPNLLPLARRIRHDAVYIPNPMEIPAVRKSPPARSAPHVILLSRMDLLKGWPRQIEVIEALRRRMPALTFSFCSEGQLPVGERDAMSRALVAMGGTPLPGMSREAFVARITASDFAVGQLELGALGMSELEAMAAGVPTIADTRAHVEQGYHPVVIRPDEAPAVVADLWSTGPVAMAALGGRARQYVTDIHHPEIVLRALEKHLGVGPGVP